MYRGRTAFVPVRCCHGTVMIKIIIFTLKKSHNAKYRCDKTMHRQVQTQYCRDVSAFFEAFFKLFMCEKGFETRRNLETMLCA